MIKKYGVVIESETDLIKGTFKGYLARLEQGEGEIALFDTLQELNDWIDKGEDLDISCFSINIIEIFI